MREGWRNAEFGDVFKTTSGGTPSRRDKSFYENGTIPWIKSGELGDGPILDAEEKITEEAIKSSSAKLFPPGTLLLAMYGATIGKVSRLKISAATNQAICAIFENPKVDSDFCFWYLKYQRPKFISQGIGGAQPNISQGIIRQLQFPLPPLPEQRAIVAKLERLFTELDRSVAELEAARAKVGVYRQSVLREAFGGRLTGGWRSNRPPEPADKLLQVIKKLKRELYLNQLKEYNSSKDAGIKRRKPKKPVLTLDLAVDSLIDLDILPSSWQWVAMGIAVQEVVVGYVGPVTQHLTTDETNGVRFLSTMHIGENGFKNDDKRYVTREFHHANPKSLVIPGDILVARHGDSGRSALIPTFINEAQVSNAVIVRTQDKFQNPKFVLHCFNYLRSYLQRKKVGGVFQVVNTKTMESFPFPLCSIEEQHQIVQEIESRFSVADHLERTIEESLARARGLRQGVLKRAFTGELLP